MQDTRANMGAHLKWDIPMFLGIASTKDGRGPSTDHVVNPAQYLSRLRKAFVPIHLFPFLPLATIPVHVVSLERSPLQLAKK